MDEAEIPAAEGPENPEGADAADSASVADSAEVVADAVPADPGPDPTLDLDALAEQAQRPDDAAKEAARARLADVAVAAAGLGRLEELAVWLAGAQGVCPTRPIERPRVVVFA